MSESVAVNSPCISVCVINAETGYCLGCFRTTDEIENWLQRSPAERARIIHQLERRRQLSNEGSDEGSDGGVEEA
jgi:predicted Fe-S protein YdhL (DUF1289 family)